MTDKKERIEPPPTAVEGAFGAEEEPEVTFESFGLHADLLKAVEALGYVRPTPIQAGTLKAAMEGRDIIGLAETGSGKTAGFLLPSLHRLMGGKGFRILVIGPTRELVNQTYEAALTLAKFSDLTPILVYGGVPMRPQIEAIEKGFDLMIATPGRLLDHVYSGSLDFPDLQILIIDEADRMFDMGFGPDIKRIIDLLPPNRQTMLFSATMPPEIEKLVAEAAREPAVIQIGRRAKPVSTLSHVVIPVKKQRKLELLLKLLEIEPIESLIIFVRTKIAAEDLAFDLDRERYNVARLHSNRTQQKREAALAGFRTGRYAILVATDVASRGLDISGVSHVINFDVPMHSEDYVHRIGRTARAGSEGSAFTFVDPGEQRQLKSIERFIEMQIPVRRIEGFDPGEGSSPGRSKESGGGKPSFQRRGGGNRPRGPRGDSGGPKRGGGSGPRGGRRP